MLEHRMAGKADLAGDPHAFVAGGDGGKGDAGLHDVAFDTVEPPEEIEMPPRAPELAVADRLQPGRFLPADDVFDFAVLDGRELGFRDLALGAAFARRLQCYGPQQAADMIGAERRLGSLHDYPHTSSAISTIMASLAHCSSADSTLPSSVEAKPHCGDRQS